MDITRVLKHLFATRTATRRRFSRDVIEAIEQAVAAIELRTSGEIRFAIDTALDIPEIWADKPPRESRPARSSRNCASGTPNFGTAYSSMY